MHHICYLAKQLITAVHVGKLGFDFWQIHNTAITNTAIFSPAVLQMLKSCPKSTSVKGIIYP